MLRSRKSKNNSEKKKKKKLQDTPAARGLAFSLLVLFPIEN